MKKIIKEICGLLAQRESFALATILSNNGSSPRTAGTKMIVKSGGSILGTIGGGLLEAQVMRLAAEVLLSRRAVTRVFNLTGSDAGQMDMICGGRLEVLVDYVDASDAPTVSAFNAFKNALDSKEKALLMTPIPSAINGEVNGKPCLVSDGGELAGHCPADLAKEIAARTAGRQPEVIKIGSGTFLVEPASDSGTIFIFGAGHVSQKIAPLAAMVNFNTVVLDDRSEFASSQRFPAAHRVVALESFAGALEGLDISRDSYLVIVTRGHAHDKTVLGQALKTGAGYIGMIGSRRKRDAIYRALSAEGFGQEDFARVFCPIGLEIEAETPEEIAVSIVAELVKVRASLAR